MAETGLDAVEAVSPPPIGDTEMWEAREAWDHRVTVNGGIPPDVMWDRSLTESDVRVYVSRLVRRMAPGDHFLVASSDNTPPDAVFSRLEIIRDVVLEEGWCPG